MKWLKTLPVYTFFTRPSTWLNLGFALLANWAVLDQHVLYTYWTYNAAGEVIHIDYTLYQLLGPILLAPMFFSLIILLATFGRHLYYRGSIDADIQDGTYLKDWKMIGPVHRIWVANVVLIGLIIALAILCSNMVKG